jgi:osmotically-inducible protein OsmY
VVVDQGKVTLEGTVDNLGAKMAAEEDAENVVGVYSVVNLLEVDPTDAVKDTEIEIVIEESLHRDPAISPYEVMVAVYKGMVILNGEVENYYEKYRAGVLASAARGVISIENNIQVDETAIPYTFDQDVLDYHPQYEHIDVYTYHPQKTDEQIARDINEQLFWSPYIDEHRIEVTVQDGMVKLEGNVDSWKAYWLVEKNAFEGGALSVNNKLEVSGYQNM